MLYTNKKYSKLVTEQMMLRYDVRPNQKRYTISFSNALTRGNFGTILNLIGASVLSNQQARLSLKNVIFGIISKQCPVFVGLQKKPNTS